MENFLEKYFAQARSERKDYRQHKDLVKQFLDEQPVLHIPNWNFLNQGRLEIIVKNYAAVLWGKGESAYLESGEGRWQLNANNPFELLKKIESLWQNNIPLYFGFLSFDLYCSMEALPFAQDFYALPDFYILFPAEMLIINHDSKEALVQTYEPAFSFEAMKFSMPGQGERKLSFGEAKESYLHKVRKIRELISEGEVYQINYTQRISADYAGSGYDFFKKLYALNSAPYSFYAALLHCTIISNSPERFIMSAKNSVQTEPIKGTIKRMQEAELDKKQIDKLMNSEKDAAELSMIVDLLRNDISKVCIPGSVVVEEHRRLETFSNVHHLVSSISGELQKGVDFVDLLRASFPGGSISGCPKIAALKYIAELEKHNRSFYTGSFFIRSPDENQFDSNILIRTAILKDNQIHFQVGGGIVIDSDPQLEYEECLAKADSFLKMIGKY